ncbi:MAG: hypothetical protein IKF48_09350 [Oscillospiraceae bacterium]|nr:hypothetical protein [Oscillospiraceae bacterium]
MPCAIEAPSPSCLKEPGAGISSRASLLFLYQINGKKGICQSRDPAGVLSFALIRKNAGQDQGQRVTAAACHLHKAGCLRSRADRESNDFTTDFFPYILKNSSRKDANHPKFPKNVRK